MGLTSRALGMGMIAAWTTGAVAGTLLTGSVFDPAGYPLPNATVSLRLLAAAATTEQSTRTDSTGNFSISNLSPGTYFLRVESPGFKVWAQNNLKIDGRAEIHLPAIMMQLGVTCPGLSPPPAVFSRIWSGMKRFFTGYRPDLTACY